MVAAMAEMKDNVTVVHWVAKKVFETVVLTAA